MCIRDSQYTSQSRKQLVHLKDDIDWLKRYIEIMQIRYENQFEVNFDIPEELMEKEVPKLFLQPLVENAIVHGFKNSEEKGKMCIRDSYSDREQSYGSAAQRNNTEARGAETHDSDSQITGSKDPLCHTGVVVWKNTNMKKLAKMDMYQRNAEDRCV